MNLRSEFNQILQTYGYPVLLVRQNKKMRCSCWDEKTQSACRECPICFGIGFKPIVEKHWVRDMETGSDDRLAQIGSQTRIGEIYTPGRAYFCRWDVETMAGDLIVEVDWTEQGKPYYAGKGIYEVNLVDPQRFERGELIFSKVYVKDQPVEKQIRGIRIANVNGIISYEIAMEG